MTRADLADAVQGGALASVTLSAHPGGRYSLIDAQSGAVLMQHSLFDLLAYATERLTNPGSRPPVRAADAAAVPSGGCVVHELPRPDNVLPFRVPGGAGGWPCDVSGEPAWAGRPCMSMESAE